MNMNMNINMIEQVINIHLSMNMTEINKSSVINRHWRWNCIS
jgi:hypothetical protein